MRAGLLALALLGVSLSRPARADVEDQGSGYDPGPATRRSGFAAGVAFGGAFGGVSGYPNELAKIDDPRYEARTGAAAGFGESVWIGGALRDWIVVGVGFHGTSVSGGGRSSSGAAFVLHLEGYPLFSQGGIFRDLGLIGEFGAGGCTIREGSSVAADGGMLSVAGIGAVYEAVRLGSHFSAGPLIQVTHQWSQSLTADVFLAAIRLSFAGGPG